MPTDREFVRPRSRVLRRLAVLFVAPLLSMAASTLHGQVIPEITPEWVVSTFLRKPIEDPAEARRSVQLWIAVRNRPEVVTMLRQIAEDPIRPRIIRSNALLAMGNSSQPVAIEYLEALLASLAPENEQRITVLFALSSGQHPPSATTIARIEERLVQGAEWERSAAASALGKIGTEYTLRRLQERLRAERSPAVRAQIQMQLRHPGRG
jgi:HEAT repeat protein